MDLTPTPHGTAIEDATTFETSLGGSAADIAAGLCKLGCRAALLTAVSDDPVGTYCIKQLQSYGVETHLVARIGGQARNSLALTEARLDGHRTLIYRNGAADLLFDENHLKPINWSEFTCLVVTGTALAVEPSRRATFSAMEQAQTHGMRVVFDVDYRPYSWINTDDVRNTLARAVALSDVIVGNDEEWPLIGRSDQSGQDAARQTALERPGTVAIYKMGPDGSVTFGSGHAIKCPAYSVEALKPVGSGDAFLAGLLAGLQAGHDLETALKRGAAAASITVTRPGCAPAMPDKDEIDAFLASR